MNIVDTILLIHIGLFCHFVSAENGFENEKILAITFQVIVRHRIDSILYNRLKL